jgi:two-component sensor histidine kinase
MDNLLLRVLPQRKHPLLVRYGISAAIVGIAALLHYSMAGDLARYPLLLFFPSVFLCSLLFDRGSGFFATVFSAVVAAFFFVAPRSGFGLTAADAVALLVFMLIGATMAGVTEALRSTIDELSAAERAKALLLEELAHRTKNDLAIISSALTLQARATGSDEARKALEAANARVQVVAAAQSRLRSSDTGADVELSEYLEQLCTGLGDMLRGVRPIAVRVHCPPMRVSESSAVSIGLIVNELVTNSLKYAFAADRGGIIEVDVRAAESGVQVSVADNGLGCPGQANGLGTRLVRLIAKQHGGRFERVSNEQGCKATALLPDLV